MNKDTLYVKRKRPTDMLLLAAIYISATLAVALLLGIILYVFVKGIHTVNWAFLTTVTSARMIPVTIPGMEDGRRMVRIICHFVDPIPRAPVR